MNDTRKVVLEENITIMWKVFAENLPIVCVVEEINDKNDTKHNFPHAPAAPMNTLYACFSTIACDAHVYEMPHMRAHSEQLYPCCPSKADLLD